MDAVIACCSAVRFACCATRPASSSSYTGFCWSFSARVRTWSRAGFRDSMMAFSLPELLLPFAIGDGLVGEFPEFCLELRIDAPEMLAKFLPAERAGAVCACVLDGLLVGEDLLPLFGVAHLLCGERSCPLVDLREPETDSTFEPVLRNLRPCTEPGPDLRDEPGLLLLLASSPLISACCFPTRAARSAISRVANPSSALSLRYSAFFSWSLSSRCRTSAYEPAVFSIRWYSASSSAMRASEASSFFACAISVSRSRWSVCCCWRSRVYAVFFSARTFWSASRRVRCVR